MTSKPICPPKPPPAVPIADGADHEPSASRATTIPDPNRAEPRKPALNWVITARPCRVRQHTLTHSRHVFGPTCFCVAQDLGRDDFIRSESLSRIDKGRQGLCGLLTFGCDWSALLILGRGGLRVTCSSMTREMGY